MVSWELWLLCLVNDYADRLDLASDVRLKDQKCRWHLAGGVNRLDIWGQD